MAIRDDDPELVDLALDGALPAAERDAALAGGPTLEQRRLQRLHAELARARVQARPGFRDEVLASLPAAPWASPAGFRLGGARAAVLALLLLGGLSTLLLGLGSGRLADTVPALGALRAVSEFAAAAALSGAGLLAASWRGVGIALGEALDLPAQLVFAFGVFAINGLLLLLLRRRSRRRAATATANARRSR
jgi:hypothetical protein